MNSSFFPTVFFSSGFDDTDAFFSSSSFFPAIIFLFPDFDEIQIEMYLSSLIVLLGKKYV